MGADLFLAHIWTTRPDKVDFAAGHAAIDRVSINEINSASFGDYPDLDDAAYLVEIVRPQLHDDLREIERYWTTDSDRATDIYQFGPVRALITGGDSWGDDPSEMFAVMTRVPEPVLTACGFLQ